MEEIYAAETAESLVKLANKLCGGDSARLTLTVTPEFRTRWNAETMLLIEEIGNGKYATERLCTYTIAEVHTNVKTMTEAVLLVAELHKMYNEELA